LHSQRVAGIDRHVRAAVQLQLPPFFHRRRQAARAPILPPGAVVAGLLGGQYCVGSSFPGLFQ
jgi:hypothetical protein